MSIPSDVTVLDQPRVTAVLFHPRPEPAGFPPMAARDVMIPVAPDVSIGARFHLKSPTAANVLFFHGNGEIVADYDALGPIFNRIGINFLCADYRGYGRSQGQPTATYLLADAVKTFDYTHAWLGENGFNGPLVVMGRSLGSAAALELAARRADDMAGLIIESGFAGAGPLLQLFGVDPQSIGYRDGEGFRQVAKIGAFHKPCLVIHGERDQLIALSQGRTLHDACGADDKVLLVIPGADHNNLFQQGFSQYMEAVQTLVLKVT